MTPRRSSAAGKRCRNPENKRSNGGPARPLKRAIAFTNTIKSSQLLEKHWDGIVERAIVLLPEEERAGAFSCETRHVDGQHHALERKSRIEWLKGESDGGCRILSNGAAACPKALTCQRWTRSCS